MKSNKLHFAIIGLLIGLAITLGIGFREGFDGEVILFASLLTLAALIIWISEKRSSWKH